jgi:hypothetical protein
MEIVHIHQTQTICNRLEIQMNGQEGKWMPPNKFEDNNQIKEIDEKKNLEPCIKIKNDFFSVHILYTHHTLSHPYIRNQPNLQFDFVL